MRRRPKEFFVLPLSSKPNMFSNIGYNILSVLIVFVCVILAIVLLLSLWAFRETLFPATLWLMLGLGETNDEVIEVMKDLRDHDVEMLTLGQYLQPSRDHLAVERWVHPDEFDELARVARELGFHQVASGPLVRSSYHADLQASGDFAGSD